MLTSDTQRYAI